MQVVLNVVPIVLQSVVTFFGHKTVDEIIRMECTIKQLDQIAQAPIEHHPANALSTFFLASFGYRPFEARCNIVKDFF